MSHAGPPPTTRNSDSLRGFSDVLTEKMADGTKQILPTAGHASKEWQTVQLTRTSRAASSTPDTVQPEGVALIAISLESSAPGSLAPSPADTLTAANPPSQSLLPDTQLLSNGLTIPSVGTGSGGADQNSVKTGSTLSSSESSKGAPSSTNVPNVPSTGGSGILLTRSCDGHAQDSIPLTQAKLSEIYKIAVSWSRTAGDGQPESSNVNLDSAAFVVQSGGQSEGLSVTGLLAIPEGTGPLLEGRLIKNPAVTVETGETSETDALNPAVSALPTALWPALAGTAIAKALAGRIVIPVHPQAAVTKQGAEGTASPSSGGIEETFANLLATPVSVAPLPVTAVSGDPGTPPASGSARAMASDPFTAMDSSPVDPLAEVMRATHHEVAVGMHDPTYGWVEIKTHLAGGQVTASLTTLSSEAQHVLQAQLPAMAEYLSSRDIHVDHLSLGETSSQARDSSSGRHSQHGEQEQKLAMQGVSAPVRLRMPARESAAIPRREYRGTSRIDVMA